MEKPKLEGGYAPVDIEKVLELGDVIRPDFDCLSSVYAHISKPEIRSISEILGEPAQQYALLAIVPQHGIMNLGEIDPETRKFELYDSEMREYALYEIASNHVVNKIFVPSNQLDELKTLDEVLGIPGIDIIREMKPKEYSKSKF